MSVLSWKNASFIVTNSTTPFVRVRALGDGSIERDGEAIEPNDSGITDANVTAYSVSEFLANVVGDETEGSITLPDGAQRGRKAARGMTLAALRASQTPTAPAKSTAKSRK